MPRYHLTVFTDTGEGFRDKYRRNRRMRYSLPSKTFNLTKFPAAGQEIEAVSPVNTRVTAPYSRDGSNWYFGGVVGFLTKGDRVSVRRLETIRMSKDAPEYIWAEVGQATHWPGGLRH
jgi:hypothetical protein